MSVERVNVKVTKEHHRGLVECSLITGLSFESLLDEALEQYLECNASVLIEDQASRSASA